MDIETEIKRQLQYLRTLQNYLNESTANSKDFSRIMELFSTPLHRIIKLNCYPLLKTFPPAVLATLELEKDLQNQDVEVQLQSLKLMACLPLTKLLSILKSFDSVLNTMIETANPYHYERLVAISSILCTLIIGDTEIDPSDMPRQTIITVFKKISDNILHVNRDVSANCIQILVYVFSTAFQNKNNLLNIQITFKELIELIPRIQLITERIFSFEVRLRSKLLILLSYLISQQSISAIPTGTVKLSVYCKNLIQRIYSEILYNSYDLDVVIPTLNVAIQIFRSNQLPIFFDKSTWIYKYFNQIQNYRKEFNSLLHSFLSLEMDEPTKIQISMKVLEIAQQIPTRLTKFLLMLHGFHNLVICSRDRKMSVLLQLYAEPWFINKMKEDPEEILLCLITVALHLKEQQNEVFEIANSAVWDGCNTEVVLMYLILVEQNASYDSIKEHMPEMNFAAKVQALLLLTKTAQFGNITQILAEFRSFMIHQQQITQVHLLTNIYIIIKQMLSANQNQTKLPLLELLKDYSDNLMERKNDPQAEKLLSYNKEFLRSIESDTEMKVQLQVEKEGGFQNQYLETLQIAYNIYISGEYSGDQDIPINNLRSLQTSEMNIFTALESSAKLITGVSDYLQVYCSHVVDLSSSQLCIGINLINNCPFNITNLQMKILIDRHTSLQHNLRVVEELPQFQKTQLFFVAKVNTPTSMHFAFDILMPDINYSMRTQNYRISLLNFMIPNRFIDINKRYFEQLEAFYLEYSYNGSISLLYSTFKQSGFAIIIEDTTIVMQAYLINGSAFGMVAQVLDSTVVFEIRGRVNRSEIPKLISELSQGLLN